MTLLAREPAASGNAFDGLADAALSAGSGLYARFATRIGVVAFSLYVLLVGLSAIVFPDPNWDMLPYIAAAGESTHPDPKALHDYAYGAVKAAVPEGDYIALTDDGGGYRSHMASDPVGFHSMLPMYRVKFLYVELLSGLGRVLPPVTALHVIQAVSALLFGAVVLLWLRSAAALALAPLAGAVLMVAEFPYAVRSSTPDMLASLLLLGALFAYTRRKEAPAAVLLVLAVMARPDNIVFVGLFAVLLIAFRQWSVGIVCALVGSVTAYLWISHWAQHPGWWPHLYFSSIGEQMNMDGFDPAFSVALYAKAFANAVVRSLVFNTWVGVALLALAAWYVTDRAGFRLERRAGILFAALVLSVLAKFVVFPIHDTRIYFPNLIPPFLILAPAIVAFGRGAAAGRLRAGASEPARPA